MTIIGKVTSFTPAYNGILSVDGSESYELNARTEVFINGLKVRRLESAEIGDNVVITIERSVVSKVEITKTPPTLVTGDDLAKDDLIEIHQ